MNYAEGAAEPMSCSIPNCTLPVTAKGMCNAHLIRQRKGRPMEPPVKIRNREGCQADGCIGKHYGQGLCKRHYIMALRRDRWMMLIAQAGGRCADCKQEYPVEVYDFHHIDEDSKEFSIGQEITNRAPEQLIAEAAKCELLCSNCHRMRLGAYWDIREIEVVEIRHPRRVA